MRFIFLTSLAAKSAWHRRGALSLILFSVAISTALLLGVERIRTQVKESFVRAISGTDLIVGARGGDIQLALYAIFHLGGATNNMSWESAKAIAAMDGVAWTIPISLGDSHGGYPVVATNGEFFKRYRFRGDGVIAFASGAPFADTYDVVIGSEIAKKLKYKLGDTIVLSHGESQTKLAEHADSPFTIKGVLSPTGTTIDRGAYISLAAMEALHANFGAPKGTPIAKRGEPKSITALLVGLNKRSQVFALQRAIGDYQNEPLMAVMPGVAMDKIWRMSATLEYALLFISAIVAVTTLLGLVSSVLSGLGERKRELAILRSAGARPLDIFALLSFEGVLLALSGIICGAAALALAALIFAPILADRYGIALYLSALSEREWATLGAIAIAGLIASLIPAIKAYRMSLADALAIE
jgi:putative ABC transport system permease protein